VLRKDGLSYCGRIGYSNTVSIDKIITLGMTKVLRYHRLQCYGRISYSITDVEECLSS